MQIFDLDTYNGKNVTSQRSKVHKREVFETNTLRGCFKVITLKLKPSHSLP